MVHGKKRFILNMKLPHNSSVVERIARGILGSSKLPRLPPRRQRGAERKARVGVGGVVGFKGSR